MLWICGAVKRTSGPLNYDHHPRSVFNPTITVTPAIRLPEVSWVFLWIKLGPSVKKLVINVIYWIDTISSIDSFHECFKWNSTTPASTQTANDPKIFFIFYFFLPQAYPLCQRIRLFMCPFAANQPLTIHFPQRLNRYACISSSSWVTFHSCIVEAPSSFGRRWRLVNIGGFVVLLHCLHSGQMPMIDNRVKGPSKETHNLNSIASVLWAPSVAQIKLLSGSSLACVSRRLLHASSTYFARVLML